MDFLDPRKKHINSIKLMIGHTLMGLVVVIGTYLLVFQAYGFDVDKKTGEVYQNGLVFLDSAPDGANITINGSLQNGKTNRRIALPEGSYKVEISKDGYRSWAKDITVTGGKVDYYRYPMLIPTELTTKRVAQLDAKPALVLNSPDRRYVLVQNADSLTSFTQYDLNDLKNKLPNTKQIDFPSNVLSKSHLKQTLSLVEWSTDNKHVLLKHSYGNSFEFIMFNRDKPSESFNVNKTLGINPDDVALRNKDPSKLYVHFTKGGVLQSVDVKLKKISPVLSGVQSFKSHGDDRILYAKPLPPENKITQIILKDKDKSYHIKDIPSTKNIPLEITKYSNDWFIVVGSNVEEKTYIFKNAESTILNAPDAGQVIAPIMILKNHGDIKTLGFSKNTQFIMVNSAQTFGVYDAENDKSYDYSLPEKYDESTLPVWMDGHRILVNSRSYSMIFDYDGTNIQKLVTIEAGLPTLFNKDYTYMYNVSASKKIFSFNQTPLRTEADQ